ncbi:hypothetical protein BD324DRAFT_135269 [Kockovaella imperatae]|uniref:Uncharacterized protein n=1 Tax=Kockovaella imperatae TaxID=4999 RepID=A0A1Y1U9U7_9TREE|nr:hypothetical protein BD324DRAFT_135269 [Kockovaella imperatae]ORX34808.1 hypothetical protein BD324DRAFT_135269 [Kockovaella imperatae]
MEDDECESGARPYCVINAHDVKLRNLPTRMQPVSSSRLSCICLYDHVHPICPDKASCSRRLLRAAFNRSIVYPNIRTPLGTCRGAYSSSPTTRGLLFTLASMGACLSRASTESDAASSNTYWSSTAIQPKLSQVSVPNMTSTPSTETSSKGTGAILSQSVAVKIVEVANKVHYSRWPEYVPLFKI